MFIGPCEGEKKKEGKGRRDGVREDPGERDQSELLSLRVEISPASLLFRSKLCLFFFLLVSIKFPWGRMIATTAN